MNSFQQVFDRWQTNKETFSSKNAWLAAEIVLATCMVLWLYRYVQLFQQVRGLYTIHSLIEVLEAPHRTKIPHIPVLIPTRKYTLQDPWKKYKTAKSDLIAYTQATTPGYAVYSISNPQVVQKVLADVLSFGKPVESMGYKQLNVFGKQLVSTQSGPEHRRHRSVVKGCFSEEVMRTVWDRSIESLDTMLSTEKVEDGGVLEHVREAMYKLTLLVIGAAGFGLKFPWSIPTTEGGSPYDVVTFHEALHLVEYHLVAELLVPVWILENFPLPSVRRLGNAQRSLRHHFKTMIATRRDALQAEQAGLGPQEKIKPPSDLLGAIVASQMDIEAEEKARGGKGTSKAGLTSEEQMGNVWIFIFAGHETSGQTLTFTLGHLAMYPEWQEKIFQEIEEVCQGSHPTYRDMNNLPSVLACVYETLRLRDLISLNQKLALKDTVLPYTTWDDLGQITNHTHTIKKGSHVLVDFAASGQNPFFYRDPHRWDPSRWYGEEGNKNRSHLFNFSAGPRACIGRRFAEVEMTAILSTLIKKVKFEPVRQKGETDEQMYDRMTQGHEVFLLTPNSFPLKFTKRQGA
ncbi:hypothetical protein M231_06349 [Tremella mesenterica]|uniref:Cytochrome P450 n=1 Tax=Tremella mesenterica TaxID=5217 RepID=A0A4Q1BGE2_TREME|nr:hypothetical protein M231_06349 [Tremella mesenterica]